MSRLRPLAEEEKRGERALSMARMRIRPHLCDVQLQQIDQPLGLSKFESHREVKTGEITWRVSGQINTSFDVFP